MCLICVEFQMKRLTISEARRNLSEMVSGLDDEHVEEVNDLLDRALDDEHAETVETIGGGGNID